MQRLLPLVALLLVAGPALAGGDDDILSLIADAQHGVEGCLALALQVSAGIGIDTGQDPPVQLNGVDIPALVPSCLAALPA